ncbi:putative membrane protein [Methanohalophilus levihalophilus]|uniref:SHOCT domain-containing protein n=1 Tax=Methanohalophilus levihalophilus TaxID=1431282 RepID=UPI001FDAA161|nr:SHOCT domain-containing protein [Methanohalophilus levihalophilus]MBP2030802.1 putative membrane protein [Methanohalophilus levihalophilus]
MNSIGYYDGSHMFFGMLFWVLVIIAIALLFRWSNNQSQNNGEDQLSAFEIAKIRYAKGEITEEEFERIKTSLFSKKEEE